IAAAKSAQDSVWMGIITGNIADIERKKGNRELAIKLILKNVSLSKRFGETKDAMRANLELANMYIANGEPKKDRGHVLDAQTDMPQKPYYLPYIIESKRPHSKVTRIQKIPQEESKYIKKYLQLTDIMDKKL